MQKWQFWAVLAALIAIYYIGKKNGWFLTKGQKGEETPLPPLDAPQGLPEAQIHNIAKAYYDAFSGWTFSDSVYNAMNELLTLSDYDLTRVANKFITLYPGQTIRLVTVNEWMFYPANDALREAVLNRLSKVGH